MAGAWFEEAYAEQNPGQAPPPPEDAAPPQPRQSSGDDWFEQAYAEQNPGAQTGPRIGSASASAVMDGDAPPQAEPQQPSGGVPDYGRAEASADINESPGDTAWRWAQQTPVVGAIARPVRNLMQGEPAEAARSIWNSQQRDAIDQAATDAPDNIKRVRGGDLSALVGLAGNAAQFAAGATGPLQDIFNLLPESIKAGYKVNDAIGEIAAEERQAGADDRERAGLGWANKPMAAIEGAVRTIGSGVGVPFADIPVAAAGLARTFIQEGPESVARRMRNQMDESGRAGFADSIDKNPGASGIKIEKTPWGTLTIIPSIDDDAVMLSGIRPVLGAFGYKAEVPSSRTVGNLAGEIAPYFIPMNGPLGGGNVIIKVGEIIGTVRGTSGVGKALAGLGSPVGKALVGYGTLVGMANDLPALAAGRLAANKSVGGAMMGMAFGGGMMTALIPYVAERDPESGEWRETPFSATVNGTNSALGAGGLFGTAAIGLVAAGMWRGSNGAMWALARNPAGYRLANMNMSQSRANDVVVRETGRTIERDGAKVQEVIEIPGATMRQDGKIRSELGIELPTARIAQPGELVGVKRQFEAQTDVLQNATQAVQNVELYLAAVIDAVRTKAGEGADADVVKAEFGNVILALAAGRSEADVIGFALKDLPETKAGRAVTQRALKEGAGVDPTIVSKDGVPTDFLFTRIMGHAGGDPSVLAAIVLDRSISQVAAELGVKNSRWMVEPKERYKAILGEISNNPVVQRRLEAKLGADGAIDPKSDLAKSALGDDAAAERQVQRIATAWRQVQAEVPGIERINALDPNQVGYARNTLEDLLFEGKKWSGASYMLAAPRYYVNNLYAVVIGGNILTQGRLAGMTTAEARRVSSERQGFPADFEPLYVREANAGQAIHGDLGGGVLPAKRGPFSAAIAKFAGDHSTTSKVVGAVSGYSLAMAIGKGIQHIAPTLKETEQRKAVFHTMRDINYRRILAEGYAELAVAKGADAQTAARFGRSLVAAQETTTPAALNNALRLDAPTFDSRLAGPYYERALEMWTEAGRSREEFVALAVSSRNRVLNELVTEIERSDAAVGQKFLEENKAYFDYIEKAFEAMPGNARGDITGPYAEISGLSAKIKGLVDQPVIQKELDRINTEIEAVRFVLAERIKSEASSPEPYAVATTPYRPGRDEFDGEEAFAAATREWFARREADRASDAPRIERDSVNTAKMFQKYQERLNVAGWRTEQLADQLLNSRDAAGSAVDSDLAALRQELQRLRGEIGRQPSRAIGLLPADVMASRREFGEPISMGGAVQPPAPPPISAASRAQGFAPQGQPPVQPIAGNAPPAPRADVDARRALFASENPHAGGALTGDAAKFDALPDDAPVWVFHATSRGNADALLAGNGREPVLQGRGILGKDPRPYVGASPTAVDGYGPVILAVQIRKGDLAVPTGEGGAVDKMTVGRSVVNGGVGAVVNGKPLQTIEVHIGKVPYRAYQEGAFGALERVGALSPPASVSNAPILPPVQPAAAAPPPPAGIPNAVSLSASAFGPSPSNNPKTAQGKANPNYARAAGVKAAGVGNEVNAAERMANTMAVEWGKTAAILNQKQRISLGDPVMRAESEGLKPADAQYEGSIVVNNIISALMEAAGVAGFEGRRMSPDFRVWREVAAQGGDQTVLIDALLRFKDMTDAFDVVPLPYPTPEGLAPGAPFPSDVRRAQQRPYAIVPKGEGARLAQRAATDTPEGFAAAARALEVPADQVRQKIADMSDAKTPNDLLRHAKLFAEALVAIERGTGKAAEQRAKSDAAVGMAEVKGAGGRAVAQAKNAVLLAKEETKLNAEIAKGGQQAVVAEAKMDRAEAQRIRAGQTLADAKTGAAIREDARQRRITKAGLNDALVSILTDMRARHGETPNNGDPRPALDAVGIATSGARAEQAVAMADIGAALAALGDDLRKDPSVFDIARDIAEDVDSNMDAAPLIRDLGEAMGRWGTFRKSELAVAKAAMLAHGFPDAPPISIDAARADMEKIPLPGVTKYMLPDGSEYEGKPIFANGVWQSVDGQPLTFDRTLAELLDSDASSMAAMHLDAVLGAMVDGVRQLAPDYKDIPAAIDRKLLITPEESAAVQVRSRDAATRQALDETRALLFGYDDRSWGQQVLDQWSPYSYWTISHMAQTARWMSTKPQAFSGMANMIAWWATQNAYLSPANRMNIVLGTNDEGEVIMFNPRAMFPFATQAITELVDVDRQSAIKMGLDLLGLSPHVPIEVALQLLATHRPGSVDWWVGKGTDGKPKTGQDRARAMVPQFDLLRMLTGGKVDIEGGNILGVQFPSLREAIYGKDAKYPGIDVYYTGVELARRVSKGEMTERDAKAALLSYKEGKPNEAFTSAMSQALSNERGIPAFMRYMGLPLQVISGIRTQLSEQGDQYRSLSATGLDRAGRDAFLKQVPGVGIDWSRNDTKEQLRYDVERADYSREKGVLDAKYKQQFIDLSKDLETGRITGQTWEQNRRNIKTNQETEEEALKARFPNGQGVRPKTPASASATAFPPPTTVQATQAALEKAQSDALSAYFDIRAPVVGGKPDFKALGAMQEKFLAGLPAPVLGYVKSKLVRDTTPSDDYQQAVIIPLLEKYGAMPKYGKGTPAEQDRWAKADAAYGEAYRAALDKSGGSKGTAHSAGLNALRSGGYDFQKDYLNGQNAESKAKKDFYNSKEMEPFRRWYGNNSPSTGGSSGTGGTSTTGGAVSSTGVAGAGTGARSAGTGTTQRAGTAPAAPRAPSPSRAPATPAKKGTPAPSARPSAPPRSSGGGGGGSGGSGGSPRNPLADFKSYAGDGVYTALIEYYAGKRRNPPATNQIERLWLRFLGKGRQKPVFAAMLQEIGKWLDEQGGLTAIAA